MTIRFIGEAAPRSGHPWTALALLWLSGMGLRLTLLAVPPVLPLIHRDLDLSETAIGILGSLPSLLLALAAIPGSQLITRFGGKPVLVLGLLLVGFGSAARGMATDVALLYLTTIVMSAGVAVMQPALPPLVRDWVPDRIGLATAVYANGLLVSETLSVALTIPIVLPLVDGSWRLSFLVWGMPVVVTALLVVLFAPRTTSTAPTQPGEVRRWWPDWRDPLVWRLSLLLGCVNTDYFATNTFLPDYLHDGGAGPVDRVLRWSPRLRQRGRAHPAAGSAAAAEPRRRRAPDGGGDVHHQLSLRGGNVGDRRLGLGPGGSTRLRVHSHGDMRPRPGNAATDDRLSTPVEMMPAAGRHPRINAPADMRLAGPSAGRCNAMEQSVRARVAFDQARS